MIEAAEPVPEYIPDIGDVVWIDFDPLKVFRTSFSIRIARLTVKRVLLPYLFHCPKMD